MRLWHFLFAILGVALVLAIAREPMGRVALVVFFTGICLIFLGTSSLMMLFRTFGEIGMARTGRHYLEAIFATAGVLFFGTVSILTVIWFGAVVLQRVVMG